MAGKPLAGGVNSPRRPPSIRPAVPLKWEKKSVVKATEFKEFRESLPPHGPFDSRPTSPPETAECLDENDMQSSGHEVGDAKDSRRGSHDNSKESFDLLQQSEKHGTSVNMKASRKDKELPEESAKTMDSMQTDSSKGIPLQEDIDSGTC